MNTVVAESGIESKERREEEPVVSKHQIIFIDDSARVW